MTAKEKQKTKEQKPSAAKKEDLEKLREKVDQLQGEKDELFAKLQRVSADYANFQKRAPRQIADTVAYEKETIIKTLLPSLDNFEHTLQKANSAGSLDAVVKGVQIIYDQMLGILKSHGVEQIEAMGERFDPALHEAMMQKSEPDKKDNIVLEEYQKGYKLNGRVIRPSRVIVNKLPPQGQKADEHQQSQDQQEQKADTHEPHDQSQTVDTD
jgi:molecular chaperone GrpE